MGGQSRSSPQPGMENHVTPLDLHNQELANQVSSLFQREVTKIWTNHIASFFLQRTSPYVARHRWITWSNFAERIHILEMSADDLNVSSMVNVMFHALTEAIVI